MAIPRGENKRYIFIESAAGGMSKLRCKSIFGQDRRELGKAILMGGLEGVNGVAYVILPYFIKI